MGILEGPAEISLAQADKIALDVQERGKGLLSFVVAEVHDSGRQLVLFVIIPDVDPFERTRLDKIFDLAEELIVSRIPVDVPIRDDRDSWSVTVVTDEDWKKRYGTIDGISGGRKKAARTNRLSGLH